MSATARILDGKAIAANLRAEIAAEVSALKDRLVRPALAVILVGDDPASQVYVRNKVLACEAAGIESIERRLPAGIGAEELLAVIGQLNIDANIHGILLQLPLPAHLDSNAMIDAISPEKDVDGLHPVNAGRLMAGLPGLVPCTPQGSLILIREAMPALAGKRAVVIGRSLLFGKPAALLLLAADCTVTICHSRTADLPDICRSADILVAAVGRAEMVRGDWIRPGAVVIDVGINRGADGKLKGDVAFDEAAAVAGAITPVPGGVGPMTIACLLKNTVQAARAQIGR